MYYLLMPTLLSDPGHSASSDLSSLVTIPLSFVHLKTVLTVFKFPLRLLTKVLNCKAWNSKGHEQRHSQFRVLFQYVFSDIFPVNYTWLWYNCSIRLFNHCRVARSELIVFLAFEATEILILLKSPGFGKSASKNESSVLFLFFLQKLPWRMNE